MREAAAAEYDDLPLQALLQLRDFGRRVAVDDRGVVPIEIFEARGHHVFRHGVHPVGQLAGSGWPPSGEDLEGPSTQQQGLRSQRLLERDLKERLEVVFPNVDEPTAVSEALLTGWILYDSIQRDVLADNDPSHHGSSFRWRRRLLHGEEIGA